MKRQRLIQLLQEVLGVSKVGKEEIAFPCPFCNHQKKKLNINLNTSKWHCWVCGVKGIGIGRIFKKVGAHRRIPELNKLVVVKSRLRETADKIVSLPFEFIPIMSGNKNSPEFRNAARYLKSRNISKINILRHNIGYCESGAYAGMIIVPSYDENGILNYFVGRSYYDVQYKHKNPKVSKDIVGFDMLVNWNEDISLCEGVFDAFAIGDNTIPLFGKFIPTKLKQKIVDKKVSRVNVILDKDAEKESLELCEKLLGQDIDVRLIRLTGESDPSDLGEKMMKKVINESERLDFTKIVEMKLGF
jgi:hypothetical protein